MTLATVQPTPHADAATSLDDLNLAVAGDMECVNRVLREKMQSSVSLIPQLAGYLIRSGGKRLRPMLTLATSKLFNYQGERHINLAACVEFIHTATLLHDDVVDESDMRRGQDSANAIWGNKPSVLVGDFLFTRSFELMVEDGGIDVLRILSKASSTVVEGEIMQLLTEDDLATPEEKYFEVIRSKTSALFAAACEVSAAIANGTPETYTALHNYGENLGLAFQLIDDMLDYSADSKTLGKKVGDDFHESKVTLPVIIAYKAGDAEEKAFWDRTMIEKNQRQGDFKIALRYVQKHQANATIQAKARDYATKAARCLDIFPDSSMKDILQRLALYCVDRVY